MPRSCAPKFIAVWPCSHSFILLTRAAQRWRTWLVFPRMARSNLSVIMSCGVGPCSDCELVIKSVMFCLSKIFYHHIHKQCYLSTFFLLSIFLHLLLVDLHDCSQASCFAFQNKKNSNHRIHKYCSLSIPLFSNFFRVCWFGWLIHEHHVFFKKLFSSHSRALLVSFTFCFSDTFGFLVNGSWSHDKLSAPYFVPCCTENIGMIEMDHSLHFYHWMHFTKRL